MPRLTGKTGSRASIKKEILAGPLPLQVNTEHEYRWGLGVLATMPGILTDHGPRVPVLPENKDIACMVCSRSSAVDKDDPNHY